MSRAQSGIGRRAWRVRVLLQLVEVVPLALPEYRRRFSSLPKEERVRLIRERFDGGRHIFGICANIRRRLLIDCRDRFDLG